MKVSLNGLGVGSITKLGYNVYETNTEEGVLGFICIDITDCVDDRKHSVTINKSLSLKQKQKLLHIMYGVLLGHQNNEVTKDTSLYLVFNK